MTRAVCCYLNQIFYRNKKFDDGSTIIDLEKWMLTHEFITKIETLESSSSSPQIDIKNEDVSREVVPRNAPIEFAPVKQDSLFWCAYTLHHGEADYWEIGNKYKNVELAEKQRIIDFINRDKATFKRRFQKMSNVGIQEIMAELMIDKKTSWKTFFAMCAYYEFRAVVIYEKTYLYFSPTSDKPLETYLFNRTKEGHISVLIEPISAERIAEIKTTCICLDQNPEKPLKAVSNYKVDELIDLAEKLGLDIKQGLYNKWKKSDWYDSIVCKCKW